MDGPKKIGRYEILERVGRGGMGVLYRGHDTVLEREVAIKVMVGDFVADETARTRFYREARAAAKLQHRNIVTVFEFGDEDGMPYIVMEFLRGQDLAHRMRAEPPLVLEEKLEIVAELCTGLQFAHDQQVIHRDVKPPNIWLLPDGTVKLLDFGIAKIAASTMTRQGSVLGSVSYMAPEQLKEGEIDARADIFSAGVVLYELLSGKKPFEADSPTGVLSRIMTDEPTPLDLVVPDLPKPLITAVAHALQKDPNKRYSRAADLGSDLRIIRTALQATGEWTFTTQTVSETVAAAAAEARAAETGAAPAGNLLDAVDLAQGRHVRATTRHGLGWRAVAALGVVLAAAVVVLFAYVAFRPGSDQPGDRSAAASGSGSPPATSSAPAQTTQPARVLKVTSDPAGASIIVDGRDTGQVTPADFPVENDGPSQIRLVKRGLQTVDTPVTAADVQKGLIAVRLVPVQEPVTAVALTGSYPFEVLDGTKVISPAAESHQLSVTGRRAIRLRAEEYFLDRLVTIDGSSRRVDIQAPELGRVTILSPLETCSVSIGGRTLGFPPVVNVPIASGSYRVVLTCPDGEKREASVTVPPGQSRREIIR